MGHKLIFNLTLLAIILLVLVACTGEVSTPTPEPTADVAISLTEEPAGTPAPEETPVLGELVPTRTPAPTATPGLVEQEVTDLVFRIGLSRTEFLGVSVASWIDLGIWLLTVLLGYLGGTILINRVLPPLARRTATTLDGAILEANGGDLRWLLVALVLQLATQQLTLIGPEAKRVVGDVYFLIGLGLLLRMTLRLIRVAETWYRGRAAAMGREETLSAVITMLVRLGAIAAWIIAIAGLLSHFGVNVTAFAAALGLGGLAISLAARDTVADAIAGMIILIDQPFRVGDRVETEAVGTWGEVVDIGLRTTRLRTGDNRLVIVANSSISHNEVINYTYPDPTYRDQTHVGVAYGSDIDQVRRVLVAAVQEVEGVLKDRPVDALYTEMNENAMIFRVRWWIETYADARRVLDRVLAAMQHALDGAGIEVWPYAGKNVSVDLRVTDDTAERVSGAFWSQQPQRPSPDAEIEARSPRR